MFKVLKDSLNSSGVELAHFDGVIPNPTTDVITNGANMAKEFNANVILGFGGGSSMDSAKAIAVEATHEGTSWDYLFYRDTQPSEKTLPVITVSTTPLSLLCCDCPIPSRITLPPPNLTSSP